MVRLYLICAKDITEKDVLINLILTEGFSTQLYFFFPKHTFLKNQVLSLTLRCLSIQAVSLNCFFNVMATFKKLIQRLENRRNLYKKFANIQSRRPRLAFQ